MALEMRWALVNPYSVLYINKTTLSPSPSPALGSAAAPASGPPYVTQLSPGAFEAATQAYPAADGSQAEESPSGNRKQLKGWSLAGVVVGAGVAAAVMGALAGYVVFHRRSSWTSSPGFPAKLRSLYGNEVSMLASFASAGRHSATNLARGQATNGRTLSVAGRQVKVASTSDSNSSDSLEYFSAADANLYD